MLISGERQLKIGILSTIIISIAVFFFFHQYALRKAVYSESEQKMFQVGKNYEFQVKSEIKSFYSLSEYISLSISKNVNQPNFIRETRNLFSDLIYRNSRLQAVELVLKSNDIAMDTGNVLLDMIAEPAPNSFRLIKLNSGKVMESEIGEFTSTKLKVAVEKANLLEQTRFLPPEILPVEGQNIAVIPVLSGIFKGQQFLGYVVLYVSVEWMGQIVLNEEKLEDYIEVFIASPDGKIISLNKSAVLKAEPIERVCLSCKDLLGNKGREFNVSYSNDLMTLCIPWTINDNKNYWHICLRLPVSELSGSGSYDNWLSWIVSLLLLILSVLLIFQLFNRYALNWKWHIEYARQIISGNEMENPDEISMKDKGNSSEMQNVLGSIAKLVSWINQSNKASIKGELTEEISAEFVQNPVAISTQNVQNLIRTTAQKLENASLELSKIKEHNEGLQKIEAELKSRHTDLNQLSIRIIQTLVDILKIEMGAVFLLKNNQQDPIFEMVVSYAYSENRFQKRNFKMGESMVGACAAEKRTIHLKKVPDDYLKIISGLGLASPKTILLVPLIFDDQVLGIIELGSLKEFDPFKIQFTERAAEIIANTFSITERNLKANDLMEKSKQQELELEISKKRINDSQEEIKQLQLKTEKNEALVRAKLDAMNNTLMMVEYTTEGIITDANYKYLNSMNYSIEDIRGIDVLDLLRESDRVELNRIIHIVKNGNFYEGIVKRQTRNGIDKWLMATYSPVFDENNTVKSILFLATDISRIRQNEEQLKQQANDLTQQVSELRKLLHRGKDKT